MKVCFVSLGCDKNRIDSEVMLHTLYDHGYEITEDEDDAEAAVVNTCCFILDAKKESIDRILEFAEKRKDGRLKALIVAGCMAQRYGKEIRKEIPEVDEIIGTTAIDQIALALDHGGGKRLFRKYRPKTGGKSKADSFHGWIFWILENCRRLQQALHLLCHSDGARRISQCTGRGYY